MPYESPARVQTRRSAAAAMATLNGGGGGLSLADEHSQQQPHAVVAQRQLGSIGAGRSGRGYSPYARRIQTRAAQYDRQDEQEEELDQQEEALPSPTRQSTGLFGKVRSLPGRMLGLLSRSSSRQSGLSSSTSLADVRAELDHQLRKEEGASMPRSRTSTQLVGAATSRAGERRAPQPAPQPQLPSSASMSALSSFAPRTTHSTLTLQPSQPPPLLRGASPATTSHSARNRSPSPLRNGLAGSMSTFQLAQQQQHPTTLGDGATANPFGLQSRSPFVDSPRRHHGAASSSYASQSQQQGHPLFPYSSNLPRGTSPSLSGSFSMRDGLSTLGGGSATGKRTFASRTMTTAASPLSREYNATIRHRNLPASQTISGGLSNLADAGEDVEMLVTTSSSATVADAAAAGAATDRARKRQLVWDPERGLVSREKLEQEKAKWVRSCLSLQVSGSSWGWASD